MKTDTLEEAVLALIFNATPIADLAENDATTPLTDLQVSLHTTEPPKSGDQESSEVVYTGYARVAVIRTSAGWTVNGLDVRPAADITFPAPTGGETQKATHIGIGTDAAGVGRLLYTAALSAPITIESGGAAPVITAADVTPSLVRIGP